MWRTPTYTFDRAGLGVGVGQYFICRVEVAGCTAMEGSVCDGQAGNKQTAKRAAALRWVEAYAERARAAPGDDAPIQDTMYDLRAWCVERLRALLKGGGIDAEDVS